MFFLGLLITLLAIDAMLLILIIIIQKGKGSMGLGALGGSTQMLFGGSGGQDLFQKITWVLGGIFMAGSMILSMQWSKSAAGSVMVARPVPAQSMPAQRPSLPQQGQTPAVPAQAPTSSPAEKPAA